MIKERKQDIFGVHSLENTFPAKFKNVVCGSILVRKQTKGIHKILFP